MSHQPFLANTDRAWFDFLSSRAFGGHIDEVNFWLPRARTPMKQMAPGEPIFFRLKKPHYTIVGYGFLRTSTWRLSDRSESFEIAS